MITVKKDNVVKGTIDIMTASNVTRDAVKILNGIDEKKSAMEQIDELTYIEDGGYYEISSVNDLQAPATYISGGNDSAGLTFKLTA